MPLNSLNDSGMPIPSPPAPPDVQTTTFAVDALGRFVCSTWTEVVNAGGAPFDAIVIGSGMYGGYFAQELYRRGGRVLVLEAGPFLVSEHVQNLARIGLDTPSAVFPTSPEAQRPQNIVWGIPWRGNQIFPGLAFCVGGKSLYWGGWSPRLTDDVLARPLAASGTQARPVWPTAARDALTSYYPVVEQQIGVSPGTDFIENSPLLAALRTKLDAGVSGIAGLEKSQSAPLAVQGDHPGGGSGLFSFDKFSSGPLLADAIREDIAESKGNDAVRNLFLVPRTRVVKLFTSGGRVTSMQVFTRVFVPVGGGRVEAREQFAFMDISPQTNLVMACSAVESTRLALESFPTELMGRNLMAHVRSNLTIRFPRSALGGLPNQPLQTAALHVPGKEDGGGRFHLQLTAAADRNSNAEAVWFRMIPNIEEVNRLLASQDADKIAMVIRGCGEMFGHPDRGAPDPNISWIVIGNEPDKIDEFGFRRVFVNLATTGTDDAVWNRMDQAALDLALALVDGVAADLEYFYRKVGDKDAHWHKDPPLFGKLNTEGGCRDPLGTTYHEAGTLWMGDKPVDSVTEPTGRFHHITNAYCIDQAILPTVGSANPVLTVLTIGRCTVDAIVRLGSPALEAGFQSLLLLNNPTDLLPAGWRFVGDGGFVRRGEILQSTGGFGLLIHDDTFDDFDLRVEWRAPFRARFPLGNNSGVFLRVDPTKATPLQIMLSGYEVQIDDSGEIPDTNQFDSPLHMTGALYERSPAKFLASRGPNEWNAFRILAQGDRFVVELNGQVVNDFTATAANSNGKPRPRNGRIALQSHFKGFRVQFRNLRIRSF